jgi:hypothetical protein
MTCRELNLCTASGRDYRALMGRMLRRVAAVTVAAIALALSGGSAAWAVPNAAVGGIQSHVSAGGLSLSVLATESEGVGLSTASALIDDELIATVPFPDGACRTDSPDVACPATVALNISFDLDPGVHELAVVVEDELGRQFVKRSAFEVIEHPPSRRVVTIEIGSGTLQPGPGPGPGPPRRARRCAAPRLSMALAQNPLRYRRGVPVLAKNRRYRFSGRLTCRVDGRRRPAPRGTEIQVLQRTRWRRMAKKSLAVGRDGRISVRLRFPSRRVVIFRARGTGNTVVSVRIPVRVAKVKRGRR